MTNKICISTDEDSLSLVDQKIHAVVDSIEYVYDLDSVEKMVILTTDMGPFYDDMGLAIDVGNNNVIFIMSGHRCYNGFLFDQIGKALPIDYQKIIDASTCMSNNVFEIYVKNISFFLTSTVAGDG